MEVVRFQNEVTTSYNPEKVMTALARANCLNLSHEVNFNKYGIKDDVGFIPVSAVYVDCFIVEHCNQKLDIDDWTNLHTMLSENCMSSCDILRIEKDKYKIASSDCEIDVVFNFISKLRTSGYNLNCIDITQDFAGSFDKDEVKAHLLQNCNFVEGPFVSSTSPTIVSNARDAHTCLQFWKGPSTRCKMYLKMPEILQSKSTRSDVGNRWEPWILKKNRLSQSRDASCGRGLTRIEVTLYMDGGEFHCDISKCLFLISDITDILPKNLIYSTPHSGMWTAYCDCFKHTLIVAMPQYGATMEHVANKKLIPPGKALIVYSFNRLTCDVSGRFVKNYNNDFRHAIERHTLSYLLPVDVIEVFDIRKVKSMNQGFQTEIEITRNRYFKSIDLPLCITKHFTLFNSKSYSQEESDSNLLHAGFVNHANCRVSLPLRQHSKISKTNCKLQQVHSDDVHDIHVNMISPKKVDPLKGQKQLKLSDLALGSYDVKSIEPRKSTFGRFLITILYDGCDRIVTSNKMLDNSIPSGGVNAADDGKPVAKIKILQKKRDHNRHVCVNAELVI